LEEVPAKPGREGSNKLLFQTFIVTNNPEYPPCKFPSCGGVPERQGGLLYIRVIWNQRPPPPAGTPPQEENLKKNLCEMQRFFPVAPNDIVEREFVIRGAEVI